MRARDDDTAVTSDNGIESGSRAAGLLVVMDRCTAIEYPRLPGLKNL